MAATATPAAGMVAVGTSVAFGYSAFVTLWPSLAMRWGFPYHLYYESAVIIVAQRVGTIRNADRIIVLEAGEVVGAGTHDRLRRDVIPISNQLQLFTRPEAEPLDQPVQHSDDVQLLKELRCHPTASRHSCIRGLHIGGDRKVREDLGQFSDRDQVVNYELVEHGTISPSL